jgi:N-acetylglutamate synthase-like GNAT family acetyltransferase
MAPVTSSSHDLQLLIPSPQFDVDDPHAEALILVFLSLVLLVRLARELVKLLRNFRKLRREFAARGCEPIVIPPGHDAQLQTVVVEANTSSRGVSSTIVEAMGEY